MRGLDGIGGGELGASLSSCPQAENCDFPRVLSINHGKIRGDIANTSVKIKGLSQDARSSVFYSEKASC